MSTISNTNDNQVTAKSPLLTSPVSTTGAPNINNGHTIVTIRTPDAVNLANRIEDYTCIRACGLLVTIGSIVTIIVIIVLHNQN